MFAAGAIAMMVGLMWHWSFPINKSLWTSSYVLFTGGLAAVSIATIMWVTDVHRVTRWTGVFVTYGLNPMVAFLGSGLMAKLIYSLWKLEVEGRPVAVQAIIYRGAFASWLPARDASLAFAVCFVLFWYGVLRVLQKRGIVFKV
jgi:predicted acyltransferase